MSKEEETDQKEEKRIGDPIPVSGIGSRVRMVVDSLGSRKAAAKAAGVGEDMVYRYLRGESEPGLLAAGGLARASGYSLQWIILGEGPMKAGPQVTDERAAYAAPARDSVDLELMKYAIRRVLTFLEEQGGARSPEETTELIMRFYDMSLKKNLIEKKDLLGLLDLIYQEHGPG